MPAPRTAGVPRAADPPPRPVAYLVAPYEQRGGGMGRIMDYLVQAGSRRDLPVDFVPVDSRGSGPAVLWPLHLGRAAARIVGGAVSGWVTGRRAIVHLNMAERGSTVRKAALVAAARLAGLPVVLHLHAARIEPFYDGLPRPARALVRAAFHRASVCVVLGEVWRRWLVGTLGVDPAKITVLRNGVPRVTAPRVPPRADGRLRVLFLGNLLKRKGLSDLLAALASPAVRGLDWEATVAGGGDAAGYRAEAEALGIGGRVAFTGWLGQEAAGAALAAADVLVLPAYDEGLPLVIIEALSVGVPVICSPVGAIPEVLEDGRTALLVPAGDRAGLAAALARVATEPSLRERLSREGRALYDRAFTIDVFTDRVLAIYARAGLAGLAAPEPAGAGLLEGGRP